MVSARRSHPIIPIQLFVQSYLQLILSSTSAQESYQQEAGYEVCGGFGWDPTRLTRTERMQEPSTISRYHFDLPSVERKEAAPQAKPL